MSSIDLAQILSQQFNYFPQKTNFKFEIVSNLPFPNDRDDDYLYPVRANDCVDEGYWLFWRKEVGVWFSQDGSEAKILIKEGCDPIAMSQTMSLGLCSAVSGIDLSFQNRIAIHGNAVSIQGSGVAFIGGSGRGKSTFSAYCSSRGAEFISDDVLLINPDGLLYPGYPQIRVGSRTMEQLLAGESDNLELRTRKHIIISIKQNIFGLAKKIIRRIPIWGKKKLKSWLTERGIIKNNKYSRYKSLYHPDSLGLQVTQKPTPLAIIYALYKSSDGSIYSEELHPARAAFKLIDHSYYAYDLVHTHPELFPQYLELSQNISVRKLYYPRNFAALPQVYDFITEEVRQLDINQHRSDKVL